MASGTTASGRRGLADFFSNLAIRAIIGSTKLVPYHMRVPMVGWIVSRIIAPVAGYSKRVRDNLTWIFPDMPEAEIKRLSRAVPDNAGRTLIEIFSGREFTERFAGAPLTGPGIAALEEAKKQQRPTVLISGHFGNYDAPRAALIARGYPVGVLYREMNNGFFNDHYVEAMKVVGKPLFPRGRKGLSNLIKFLRGGGMTGLLIDQYMSGGEDLTFFGQIAPTALSAMELALKYDALVIPIYGIRQPNGLDFEILVEEPVPHSDPATMTQALNDSLEVLVRQHMEQWFWIHRRWKPEQVSRRQSMLATAKTGPETPS
ncbi:MAG: lysophospholipid acyltransferase family protein [Litoreibacter sp.]